MMTIISSKTPRDRLRSSKLSNEVRRTHLSPSTTTPGSSDPGVTSPASIARATARCSPPPPFRSDFVVPGDTNSAWRSPDRAPVFRVNRKTQQNQGVRPLVATLLREPPRTWRGEHAIEIGDDLMKISFLLESTHRKFLSDTGRFSDFDDRRVVVTVVLTPLRPHRPTCAGACPLPLLDCGTATFDSSRSRSGVLTPPVEPRSHPSRTPRESLRAHRVLYDLLWVGGRKVSARSVTVE